MFKFETLQSFLFFVSLSANMSQYTGAETEMFQTKMLFKHLHQTGNIDLKQFGQLIFIQSIPGRRAVKQPIKSEVYCH